ncbi:hypothetical protein B0H21DRAFT_715990 [Amylocystis lapponica]|nr:hypothetical protein B0H21DRAFT_715990 [Amylocystis lapponica]
MGPVATFLRARAIAFTVILLTSLVWSILLCVESSAKWDVSDDLQRNLVLILILVNACTTIGLPALLLFDFLWWSDAASIALLFLSHLGIAVVFTLANPSFTCPDLPANPDFKTINVVILVFSWVNPALLLAYAVGLVVTIYRRLHSAWPPEDLKRKSELPMMLPPADARSSTNGLTSTRVPSDSGLPQWAPSAQRGPRNSALRTLSTVMEEDSGSPRSVSSGRLSKRLPRWFY